MENMREIVIYRVKMFDGFLSLWVCWAKALSLFVEIFCKLFLLNDGRGTQLLWAKDRLSLEKVRFCRLGASYTPKILAQRGGILIKYTYL